MKSLKALSFATLPRYINLTDSWVNSLNEKDVGGTPRTSKPLQTSLDEVGTKTPWPK